MEHTALKNRLEHKVQDLQNSHQEIIQTSLSPTHSDYLAFADNTLDVIRENLKSQPLSLNLFDLVKSPSGGSTVFSVPGLSGEEPQKELSWTIQPRGPTGIPLIQWKELPQHA